MPVKPIRTIKRKLITGIVAGSLAFGAVGCAPPSPKQIPKARTSRVNSVSKEQTRSTVYESRDQKPKPIVDPKKAEQDRKSMEESRFREEQKIKRVEFIKFFLEDPVQGLKKIKAIRNKELRDQYANWAIDGASNIDHFERVYNACKDKEFQKELIRSFGDSFVGSGDGGFQHAYDLELLLEIKNVNLRQSVFERILYGHAEGDTATVLSTLHHQYEYDALVQLAKTLPNAKKYILELQKQKKIVGRDWEN